MFVQVIKGTVADAAGLRRQLDAWNEKLRPGAPGYLGTTAGVTDDGTFIGIARFESRQAAQRNSSRAEQSSWWITTEKCFAGTVEFVDCDEVIQYGAPSDQAGFVQFVQGRIRDEATLRRGLEQATKVLPNFRPDLLGSIMVLHGDGSFTEANYFTSEAEARAGEAVPPPPEAQQLFEDSIGQLVDPSFYDLRTPWLYSA